MRTISSLKETSLKRKTSPFSFFPSNPSQLSAYLCHTHSLGLEHLIGTPALKPYMHGYFLSLKLYETARVIANPFEYDEYREKMVKEKMEKMVESRIRTRKDAGVKVNKGLAEKILRDEGRARKKAERKARLRHNEDKGMDGVDDNDEGKVEEKQTKPSLLADPRFAKVFEDQAFAIDEDSREFALLNPSAALHRRVIGHAQTAVEADEESDASSSSSDEFGRASDESGAGNLEDDDDDSSSNSSDDGK